MHQVEIWKDYDKLKDQVDQLTQENNKLKTIIMELQNKQGT